MSGWKAYSGVLILLSVTIGVILNPIMPEMMASHWNWQNQIDGHLPKFWVLFGVPFLMIFFTLLFSILVRLDPIVKDQKEKIKMDIYFDKFVLVFIAFLFYIYVIAFIANLNIVYKWGLNVNIGNLVIPSIGVLFFFIGLLIKDIPRNWFAGIRTPWTLSSPEIWKKTHLLGGTLFMVSGVIVGLSFLWPDIAMQILLISLIPAVLAPVAYSLYLYLKKK